MKTRLLILALLTAVTAHLQAATLQDFGYEHMTVNGEVSTGHRPMLVILASFTGAEPFGHGTNDTRYYDDLMFNFFTRPGVNNYFLEVSDGRFFWSRGGLVSVTLPFAHMFTNFNPNVTAPRGLRDQLYASNIIHRAMTTTSFNFAGYDDNNNGTVSQEELQIVIISNDGEYSGANRGAGCIRPSGSALTVCAGSVALLNHRTGIATICHELSHSLGTLDLYGADECLNRSVSLMSCTLSFPDDPDIYHLDPWHKLQLGWVEPRIFSATAGGYASVPAAQVIDPNTPIILYDPAQGVNDFFILEYRARNRTAGPFNDANTSGNGLALWRVRQDSAKNPVLVPRVDGGVLPAQGNWRWCSKCQGLHHIGPDASNPVLRPCPEGGMHSADGGYQVVLNNPNAPGQHGWRWCQKCSSMFHGPGQATSRCASGGTHDGSGSGDYSFVQNDDSTPGQKDWRWCSKCQSLFFGLKMSVSDCPAGGRHDGSTSGNYAVLMEGQNYVVWSEAAPDFTRGGGTLWPGGSITPYLRRLDGSETRTRLYVHPFAVGAESIVVEWWNEQEYWVDYNYPGGLFFPEFGAFDFPYNTLGEAASVAPFGGIVSIKSGTGNESINITKRLRLQAYGGPVTIGR